MNEFSIIIPVYNEERTIGNLIRTLVTFQSYGEILIVNDGSTDRTGRILEITKKELPFELSKKLSIFHLEKNYGKGFALSFGVNKSKYPATVFLDGDITNISERDLLFLVSPLFNDEADMVLGIDNSSGKFYTDLFNILTGERAIWKKDIISKISVMKKKKYGIEAYLNSLYEGKRVRFVEMFYVSHLIKFTKVSIPKSVMSYIKEGQEVARELLRQKILTSNNSRQILRKINKLLGMAKSLKKIVVNL